MPLADAPSAAFFESNRRRLAEAMKPKSLAVVNNNDVFPTNADGSMSLHPSADLYYLTGIDQEESILVFFPDAFEEKNRAILFLRETSELIQTWEGEKLTKADAERISGVKRVEWLGEFSTIFHALMCEADHVYLNSNDHPRAKVVVETREARFVRDCLERYPLHEYHRLSRIMYRLRSVKSEPELALIRKACGITRDGFARVAKFVRPGVNERNVEAEFDHEFRSQGGQFAYTPIVASGINACALHYIKNNCECRDGDLLLLDVAAAYGHYNSDLTRTIPVNGRFTKRQRQVYDAVLRVHRACLKELKPGVTAKDWRAFAQQETEKELVDLKLLTTAEVRDQGPDKKALNKYFMHGIGHSIGLDVHDVQIVDAPVTAGWVMTCEPAIYIRDEGFGIRIEDTVLVTESGGVTLMPDIPIEAEAIESLMASRG